MLAQMRQGATGKAQILFGTVTMGGSGQGTATLGQALAGETVMPHPCEIQHGSAACTTPARITRQGSIRLNDSRFMAVLPQLLFP